MTVEILTDNQIFETKQGGDITYKDMVEESVPLGESQIQKLFSGSSVLLTGGTGFLGKLVVEKLLRSVVFCAKRIFATLKSSLNRRRCLAVRNLSASM